MHLDSFQREAATWNRGACLVLAGAGSGKTTVLTERICYLIREAGVSPDKILVITFTRDAAQEMKTRFLQKSGETGQRVSFGTFHSVFFFILRTSMGYTHEDLLSGKRKREFLKACMLEADYPFTEDPETYRKAEKKIGNYALSGAALEDWNPADSDDGFRDVIRRYEEKKNAEHVIDFDDLMKKTRELFLTRPDILKQWRARWSYFMVDEMQDMNPVQHDILRLLAAPENNVFAVGDDDQSIYGFRNASPHLMLDFPKQYPGCRVLQLQMNYRSAPEIVVAAEKLISQNAERFSKKFHASSRERGEILVKAYASAEEEAKDIADRLERDVLHDSGYLISKDPEPHNTFGSQKSQTIGVLFRNRSHSALLRQELLLRKIPFFFPEEKRNPYEHFIFLDVLSYLKLSLGEEKREYYLRVMNRPLRYIPRAIFPHNEIRRTDILAAAGQYQRNPRLLGVLTDFFGKLDFLGKLSPFAAVNYIRRGLGYDAYLNELAGSHPEERKDWTEKMELIQSLSRKAHSRKELVEQLEKLQRTAEQTMSRQNPENSRISLYTFHGSKGLEFDTVYILNAAEGAVPSAKAVTLRDLEEERRMFYVAVTRAKNTLLIATRKNDSNKMRAPSRFLREMSSAAQNS